MVANPSWRVKNASGGDVNLHGQYMYALEVAEMKAEWIKTCVDAVEVLDHTHVFHCIVFHSIF
jgi:hypothetical protein